MAIKTMLLAALLSSLLLANVHAFMEANKASAISQRHASIASSTTTQLFIESSATATDPCPEIPLTPRVEKGMELAVLACG